jgi:hypothetical protein
MKPTTVLLLVICGSLLLLVGAFAVFFARGGEVMLWVKMSSTSGGGMIEADEAVAREIAKMDFTFSPIPNLTVHFQGKGYQEWQYLEGKENNFMVFGDINVTGKVLRAIPSGREYQGITGEELHKQLTREIQSRLPADSELHFTMDSDLIIYFKEYFREYPEKFRQNNQ